MFVHIPKTGGTSVEHWFQKVYGKEHVVVHKHAPISYKNLNDLEMFKFATIRNPFSRAVSWYQQALSLILLDESIKRFHIHGLTLEAWEKGFDYFVQNFYDRSSRNPGDDIDISPAFTQWSYVSVNGKLAVDHLVRFEDLDQEWKKIEEMVGTNYGLGKLKVGPSDALRDWKKVYTPSSKKLIEEIYKEDFEKFNYEY